jgi:hypothetical protein
MLFIALCLLERTVVLRDAGLLTGLSTLFGGDEDELLDAKPDSPALGGVARALEPIVTVPAPVPATVPCYHEHNRLHAHTFRSNVECSECFRCHVVAMHVRCVCVDCVVIAVFDCWRQRHRAIHAVPVLCRRRVIMKVRMVHVVLAEPSTAFLCQ